MSHRYGTKFEVKVNANIATGGVDLYIIRRDLGSGAAYLALPLNPVFERVDEGAIYPRPTISIDGFAAQEIMKDITNQFERKGIVPDSQERIEGVLEATREHLSDMRKLVFK